MYCGVDLVTRAPIVAYFTVNYLGRENGSFIFLCPSVGLTRRDVRLPEAAANFLNHYIPLTEVVVLAINNLIIQYLEALLSN